MNEYVIKNKAALGAGRVAYMYSNIATSFNLSIYITFDRVRMLLKVVVTIRFPQFLHKQVQL